MANKKTTEEVAKELLDKYSLVLEGEYLGAHKDIHFRCVNGHLNKGLATNVLRRGYKCKECLHGRSIVPKVRWTDTELEKIRTLISTGTSTISIAEIFNTTANAIHNACAKHGITNNTKVVSTKNKLANVLEHQERTLVSGGAASHDFATIVCSKGHTATQYVGNVVYKDTGCPQCFAADGVSKQEQELRQFIEENYNGWIIYNDRALLEGKEIDILLPDLGLAIEFNGTYWHREEKVGQKYHLNKTTQVEAEDFKLLHIYDYYWSVKKDIVKSRVLSSLGKTNKIYARSTDLKYITGAEANKFMETNHIQGFVNSSINLGLMYNDNLVAVMSFSRPRFSKSHDYELTRYASILNTTVVGGASKLFKHRPSGSIISYADRSYSTGDLYRKLGFVQTGATDPSYAYYNRTKRLSRYQCQKHLLPASGLLFDPDLTEKQNMQLNNYYPVYDSGSLIFSFH